MQLFEKIGIVHYIIYAWPTSLIILAKLISALGTIVEYSGAFISTSQLKCVVVHFFIAATGALFFDGCLLHRLKLALAIRMAHELTFLTENRGER